VSDEPEPVKPSRNDYPDPDAWDAAMLAYAGELSAHKAGKAVAEALGKARKEAEQRAATEAQRVSSEAYTAREQKIKEKHADFDEVASRPDVSVPMPVVHAILTDERGPELKYYFGQHPEEAERFLDKNLKPLEYTTAAGSFKQQMGELNKYERSIMSDKTLSATQKRKELDEIKQMKIDLAKEFMTISRE
jgi:hypothetical protein